MRASDGACEAELICSGVCVLFLFRGLRLWNITPPPFARAHFVWCPHECVFVFACMHAYVCVYACMCAYVCLYVFCSRRGNIRCLELRFRLHRLLRSPKAKMHGTEGRPGSRRPALPGREWGARGSYRRLRPARRGRRLGLLWNI